MAFSGWQGSWLAGGGKPDFNFFAAKRNLSRQPRGTPGGPPQLNADTSIVGPALGPQFFAKTVPPAIMPQVKSFSQPLTAGLTFTGAQGKATARHLPAAAVTFTGNYVRERWAHC